MEWNELFPPGEPVMALPNWERPRLLVSGRSMNGRWKDGTFYPAHRTRAKAYKFLIQLRATVGMQQAQIASGTHWKLAEYLEGIVQSPMSPAVRLGTPCAAYKWTLRVCDASGKVAAYVKWGQSESARRRLIHEHAILSALPCKFGPKPLKLGPLGKGLALCLAPVVGQPLSSFGHRIGLKLSNFLEQQAIHTPLPIDEHPGFARLAPNAPPQVARWMDQLRDRAWQVVIQHGDLAPWNVFVMPDSRDDRLAAVDWEYGTLQGAAFFDAAYYWIQIAALIQRRDPNSAMEFAISKLTQNPWPGLSAGHAEAITALAVYDAWRLAMSDGDSPDEPLQKWQREIWCRKPRYRTLLASRYVPRAPVISTMPDVGSGRRVPRPSPITVGG